MFICTVFNLPNFVVPKVMVHTYYIVSTTVPSIPNTYYLVPTTPTSYYLVPTTMQENTVECKPVKHPVLLLLAVIKHGTVR